MSKFSSYLLWICSSRIASWLRSPTATSAFISVKMVHSSSDLMTAEFTSDCHQRALNRSTPIPISQLPRLLLSSRRITTSPILRAFGLQTVAYSQVEPPSYLKLSVKFIWLPVHSCCNYHFSNDFVFGLGFCIDCSHWVWPPRIAAVTTQVYPNKRLHQSRKSLGIGYSVLSRRHMSPLLNHMFLNVAHVICHKLQFPAYSHVFYKQFETPPW